VPTALIIAGPNGAGKTTFAREYLTGEDEEFIFVNADELARSLAQQDGNRNAADFQAGRLMLTRVEEFADAGANFAIETTLATRIYARKIPRWRRLGYEIALVYLQLESVEESVARVRKRVEAGGHGIPEEVIRRRFSKSNDYFEMIYKPLVDTWYLWESREGRFIVVDARESQ
jgi:predicted ABC-type ATPase